MAAHDLTDGPNPADTTFVDVLVVCYNSLPHVVECVRSYLDSTQVRCRVLVVDNASIDGSVEVLTGVFGDACVVVPLPRNLGYGGAVNAAWSHTRAPWVVVSNADVLATPSMIRDLLDTATVTGAAAVTPALTYPDGRAQPGFSTDAGRGLRRRSASAADRLGPHVLRREEYLDGAVLLVSRQAYEVVGGFDERFFFYGEDVALSRALHIHGYQMAHAPAASGVHARGSDSRQRSPQMLRRSAMWLASAKLMNLQDRSPVARRRRAGVEACWALLLWLRELARSLRGAGKRDSAEAFQRRLLTEYLGYALLARDPDRRHSLAVDVP